MNNTIVSVHVHVNVIFAKSLMTAPKTAGIVNRPGLSGVESRLRPTGLWVILISAFV